MRRSRFAVVAAVVVVLSVSGGVVAAGDQVGAGGHRSASTTGIQSVNCTYPIEVTDATGQTVTVEQEPQRVVVLGSSAAQVTWAIGAKSKVVGMPVGYATAYLNGSQNRTNVVNAKLHPVTEKVVAAKPDLVIAPNIIKNKTVENLREKGLTVVRLAEAKSVDDVAAKTQLIGRLVGAYDKAARVSARTTATVRAVRQATDSGSDPGVYYAMGGGYTAGNETFIGDVIEAAGGDNIATAAGIEAYKPISEEVVVSEDPEWIVTTSRQLLPKSEAINSTTAIQQDQVLVVDGNYISQPGPRVTGPLTKMAGAFHPEAAGNLSIDPGSVSVPQCASDVTPETTNETTPTTSGGKDTVRITTAANPTGTRTDDGSTDSGSGFGPGFGVVAALLALVTAGLFLERR
ncbi:MAG: PGF-CTERM-anchored ABC transporter substrate-binding protein [Halapricum sp.]